MLTSLARVIPHSLRKVASSSVSGASCVLCFLREALRELDLKRKLLILSMPEFSSSSGVP